jgi:dihydrofolate reductase
LLGTILQEETMIKLIWAQDKKRAIGKNGQIPWNIPEDLKHFKTLTGTDAVVMGRRTWESLPEKYRPLPNRYNYILTRDQNYNPIEHPQVEVINSFDELVVRYCQSTQVLWVIGGQTLYEMFMPFADEIYMTSIDLDVEEADTFAPLINYNFFVGFRYNESNPVFWKWSSPVAATKSPRHIFCALKRK